MAGREYYMLFMLLAAGVFLVSRWLMPKPPALASLRRFERVALLWAALVGGAFGAKIGFTLAYGGDWFASQTWLTDGKTVTTALVGAYLAVELTKLVLRLPVKLGDTFALPLALALAVGRWGCFYNGCCFGLPTDLPWGMDFGDGIARHPTQIYESLFHLGMALLLGCFLAWGIFRYQQLKFYLIGYAVFRFLVEYIRPEPPAALGLTFYQWVCLLMIVALAAQWLYDRRLVVE